MKQPKKTTLKAHEKMEHNNGLRNSAPRMMKKAVVDKKAQLRIKEEKAIMEGGEAWRQYMNAKGFDDVERHDPSLLFQVYGPAPEPDAISSSDEEIATDETTHSQNDSCS